MTQVQPHIHEPVFLGYWLKQQSFNQAGSHYKSRTFWPAEAASAAGAAAMALAMRAPRCSSIRVLTTQMGLVTQQTYTKTQCNNRLTYQLASTASCCRCPTFAAAPCAAGAWSIDERSRALPFSTSFQRQVSLKGPEPGGLTPSSTTAVYLGDSSRRDKTLSPGRRPPLQPPGACRDPAWRCCCGAGTAPLPCCTPQSRCPKTRLRRHAATPVHEMHRATRAPEL